MHLTSVKPAEDNQTNQSATKTAAKEPFMGTVRELVWAYQAFRSYSDTLIRQMGLTSSQFDVISTLGNTPGMTFHKLAEKTLTTKGELTGIIDRLEKKRLSPSGSTASRSAQFSRCINSPRRKSLCRNFPRPYCPPQRVFRSPRT